MRIAVTGRDGQVATSLRLAARGGPAEIVCLARPGFDLERPDTIAPALAAAKADLVVSAAAWTAVDAAEDAPERARAVNADGAGALAAAAAGLGIPIVHLSTDYVFDGTLGRPYREDDAPSPATVYGATKLAGEKAVAAANPNHLILRTAWIYGAHGRNFVRTMVEMALTRPEIAVVADQRGSPTSAADIARAVLALAPRIDGATLPWGLYHLAGSGEASWAELAEEVMAELAAAGMPSASIRRIATSGYPTRAPRPADSRLDCSRAARELGLVLPDWRSSCRAAVAAIRAESAAP